MYKKCKADLCKLYFQVSRYVVLTYAQLTTVIPKGVFINLLPISHSNVKYSAPFKLYFKVHFITFLLKYSN